MKRRQGLFVFVILLFMIVVLVNPMYNNEYESDVKMSGKVEYMEERTQHHSLKQFMGPTAAWFSDAFGTPTPVQQDAWPAIASGQQVLISAPTGTGKTLSAFLVFIDRLLALADKGELKEALYLIYVSPLKSLAGDIRENLNRPLEGIAAMDGGAGAGKITVAIRTGDTPQKDRQRMVKHPPHILITTPESLYLMLTGKTGRTILKTAQALIIDELHAMIDTKRGAHLMLSAARLDMLCGRPLQRIGLSATIEPLAMAAAYLSPEPACIIAPPMKKDVMIRVDGLTPATGRKKDPVWEELAAKVYDRCLESRSVIAFSEGRRYVEKLAYYVNQLGGEGFARVHHGSLSREQRAEAENALRSGELRLLCATSSMELGIDVGDIDQVLQVGCPRTISSTMQRLGRAGHNPGRVSVMYMYPRTSPETLYCGMTARVAREGGVEQARPPRLCFDVLAQHLVSMAAVEKTAGAAAMEAAGPGTMPLTAGAAVTAGHFAKAAPVGSVKGIAYTVDDVMAILSRTYTFREVTRGDVKSILGMLAGDYEHRREIPVRPRILYDRLHERVFADAYSRMLAVAAGGTIPDKGLYMAKTEDGVKVGELDEEFVYESQLGDRFLLGAFAWKIVGQDKDTVIVTQANVEGARLPFWKGEIKGRDLRTSLAFGKIMRGLSQAMDRGMLKAALEQLGLDGAAVDNTAGFLERQKKATGILPDDRTIVIEHFKDSSGCHQMMVHALFGRRINTPLSLLIQDAAKKIMGCNVGCVDEEDGILLYPYGEEALPEGIFTAIDYESVRDILETVLPVTPVFNMTFRYNAARALMMGMKRNGRQPLWMQRLRSTEMLESLVTDRYHPLIRETRRECLEDQWDIDGVLEILSGIRSGQIAVRELFVEIPSPLSLPMQWRVEAAEMYEYTPTTPGIRQAVYDELRHMEQVKPSAQALHEVHERKKLPEDANGLHTLLMIEGDVTALELWDMYAQATGDAGPLSDMKAIVASWLEELAGQKLVEYIEPGLWIAAEHSGEYARAISEKDAEAGMHIVRRMLYYRGPHTAEQIRKRYLPEDTAPLQWLEMLCDQNALVRDNEYYYHGKLYDRARRATIRTMRTEVTTQPPQSYAALMAERSRINATPEEQLKQTLDMLCGQCYPVAAWEGIVLNSRVRHYSEGLLDRVLTEGDYFWKMNDGSLGFYKYEDIDWDVDISVSISAPEISAPAGADTICDAQAIVYRELCRRGASFLKALASIPGAGDVKNVLMDLAEKGLVCADSFVPVRQWQNRDKLKKATVRQRVNARVAALSAGRWDIVRPLKPKTMDQWLEILFQENILLCRETFRRSIALRENQGGAQFQGAAQSAGAVDDVPDWGRALELLRIWEFTGRVRRGYFIRGLSGAQFIRSGDYDSIVRALAHPEPSIVWLNAADPAQLWGKVLPHEDGRAYLNVPGTVVALKGGLPVMVLERQGRVLRLLGQDPIAADKRVLGDCGPEADASSLTAAEVKMALREFVHAFQDKALFPDKRRLIIKEYPDSFGEILKSAGFMREMMDYVLYR